ncbi:hypothetical protein PWG71_00905 [Nocardiopsis sp. N85]|nr:hypothetical protein [Nocardiopsis sp. N85]MDE3719930.1 hypothetical protein [Nocardiopsis sp. N85]
MPDEILGHLLLAAAIGGLVTDAPVGRPIGEVIAAPARRGGPVPTERR